jgi:hypothetical protein
MAIDPTVRSGFPGVRCAIHLDPEPTAAPRLVSVALERAQRLCVTLDTLRNGVPVEAFSTVGAPGPASLVP